MQTYSFKRLSEKERCEYVLQKIMDCLRRVLTLDAEDDQLISLLARIFENVEVGVVSLQSTHVVTMTEVAMQLHRLKFVPATKAFIQGLERVRLLNLGPEEIQGVAPSCAICMEGFADIAAGNVDETAGERLIARLPCSHLFHSDCIFQWLEIGHLCPTCRFTMPIKELEGEPSEPSNTMPVLVEAGKQSQALNTMPIAEAGDRP